MSEYFPLDQIFAEKEVPVYRRLAAYNDDFLIKSRRFLRGDENMTGQIAESIRRTRPPVPRSIIWLPTMDLPK